MAESPACEAGRDEERAKSTQTSTSDGRRTRTQVIGFRNGNVLSMPLEEIDGVQLGDTVIARREQARVPVGPNLLGRVLDGFGRPMDGGPPIRATESYELIKEPPSPLEREHIVEPLTTGFRVIDGLMPCGKGQRIGIFGGSGVGKSTLLGSMVRHNSADVSVVALVGERNREVRAFLDHDLGEEGWLRAVLVVSTSDRPAPLRVRACFVALAIAEYFRDQGANVLLVMDSVTRLALAQREIGLAPENRPARKATHPRCSLCCPHFLNGPATSTRVHHGFLHGAGGRRRFQRAGQRRRPSHSRWPYHFSRQLAAGAITRPLTCCTP